MTPYSVLKDGVVVRTGFCSPEDLQHQAREGETVVEDHLPFPVHDEVHHWSYQRKLAYPRLEVFVDAYYWLERGDDTKMKEYLDACEEVKRAIPKS